MSSLTVEFTNKSTHKDTDVSIGFVPGAGTSMTVTTNASGTALSSVYANGNGAGNWYSLPDLSGGISVSSFSGRVYVCYGTPWEVVNSGYEPAQTPTDPNFFRRYDKMEMTFTGQPTDVADLTSIDYWAIPMSLETLKSGAPVASVRGFLGKGTDAATIYSKLTDLTANPANGLPALVPGKFKQMGNGPNPGKSFARIIGPSSYPPIYPAPGGVPVTPYDRWEAYLQFLHDSYGPGTAKTGKLGNGIIARIAGKFAGVGPNPPSSGPTAPQKYDYWASIDKGLNVTLTEVKGSTRIEYKKEDLMNPAGIYGGNTPYYKNGAKSPTNPGNDVYGWIGGDLFSGFNIGAVGSSATVGKHVVGEMPSQDWFKLKAKDFFSGLQPNAPYFNKWAATLSPLSDAYNFAYSDRFAPVFASLNPSDVDTLKIILLEDKMQSTEEA